MHFGIFLEERRRGVSESATLRETIGLAEAAEAGASTASGSARSTSTARARSSRPLSRSASFLAARTRRLRIGIAVQVLPLGNPLRIAEEAATVDQLSEGRPGLRRRPQRLGPHLRPARGAYGRARPASSSASRSSGRPGRASPSATRASFYRFPTVTVAPTPYQVPHPPMAWPPTRRRPSAGREARPTPLHRAARPRHPAAARPPQGIPRSVARIRTGRVPRTCSCASRSTRRRPSRPPARSRERR